MSFFGTSLPNALCQVLRAQSAITTAFGDTWDSSLTVPQNVAAGNVSKFWSDEASDVAEPYLVFEEVAETYDFMSTSGAIKSFIANGSTIIRIFDDNRDTARSLGILVCNALNDCDLEVVTWPAYSGVNARLMNWRMSAASFQPMPMIGPNVPIVFNRVISCDYTYQGGI